MSVNSNYKPYLPIKKSFVVFWLSVSMLYSLIFTTIEFSGNPFSGIYGFVTLAIQWSIVAFSVSGIICLIAINRYIFACLFPILTLLSGILAYYELTMHVSLTPMLIELALVNDMNTWTTVMSMELGLWIGVIIVISALIVWVRIRYIRIDNSWIYVLCGIFIILVPTCLVSRFKAPVSNRMPYSFYYSAKDFVDGMKEVEQIRNTFDNIEVTVEENSPDVIVVIGESLRSDHVSLNGYERNTFPNLGKDTSVVSLPNVYTEAWCTHTSVPHIVTNADSLHNDRAYHEQSFITLFKKAHYHTSWLSNQDANKSYVYFMHEADTCIMGNATKSMYNFDLWLDTELLSAIKETLDRHDEKKLLVIHSIGSHWWYRSHYPDSLAVFRPEIDSRVLSDLSKTQLINSYDNTIIATDDFLYKIIELLRHRNALMVYISDHGEALGENGNYLHADNYPQLHNPACLVWYSSIYKDMYPEKVANLRKSASKRWLTDAIFHSVLDGATIDYEGLQQSQSFFSK